MTREHELMDHGKFLEAGWVTFEHEVIHPNAPQIQRDEMRTAFFAGAHQVLATLSSVDVQDSKEVCQRLKLLVEELGEFVENDELAAMPAAGSA